MAALVVGAYAVARETSLFAVKTIDIAGGSPRIKAEVRRALQPEVGRSLISLSGADIDRRVAKIPDVVSVSFDRSFPSTLHVTVKAERAVLLVRQGSSSWVISSRGRVMRKVTKPAKSSLPRLWLPKSVHVAVGETLPRYDGKLAAAAVAPIAPGSFHGGIRNVASSPDQLTLVLALRPADQARGYRRPAPEAHDRPPDPAYRLLEHDLAAGGVRRCQRPRAARARDRTVSSRKYRLRFRLIETSRFGIDKQEIRPYAAKWRGVSRTNPAVKLEVEPT